MTTSLDTQTSPQFNQKSCKNWATKIS